MFERVLVVLLLSLGAGLLIRFLSNRRVLQISRDRLSDGELEVPDEQAEPAEEEPPLAHRFLHRHPFIPWICGGAVFLVLWALVGLKTVYAATFGAVVFLVTHEVEAFLAARKTVLIETQLANAIDLMVASLRAGAGVLKCFEAAIIESRPPLRPQLEEVLGRIRYGDQPSAVYRGLVARVPLETFQLFASALAVHGEVGGSLASTLATVGRIIRDRIELSRRIRSMTSQSRASTIAVLCTTYFIALVMWRTDPDRMEEFLDTTVGSLAMSAAVILQGVGFLWISAMSRLKY
jgi:tight adherence protein B